MHVQSISEQYGECGSDDIVTSEVSEAGENVGTDKCDDHDKCAKEISSLKVKINELEIIVKI